MNALISKARKPKFDLNLSIIDLNNVPLVSGTSHVKWHLPSSTAAEHRGRTPKSPIKDHKVTWNYTNTIPIRLTIDKVNNLQETFINFEVVQDYSSGGRGEKITLGFVTLNLAEYVEESEALGEGEGSIVRRYLMQESKINSTLKIGIAMKQVDGERNFVAPPLKTAPVFGGIAGIMAGEQQGERDDLGDIPTINKSRDASELQDMYRRSLASSWVAQAGELPADQCVEDIFNGGTGWKNVQPGMASVPGNTQDFGSNDDLQSLRPHHHRTPSGSSETSQSTIKNKPSRMSHKHTRSRDSPKHGPSTTILPHEISSESSDRGRTGFKNANEVDEISSAISKLLNVFQSHSCVCLTAQ